MTRSYAHFKSAFDSGSDRTRFPVAMKIALHSAGTTGGSAGSPSPVTGESLFRKCTSIGAAWRRRSSGKLLKLLCFVRPFSIVISWSERFGDAVEHRALHLVLGVARVDDLAADVADDPDLVDLHVAAPCSPSPARLRRSSRDG